MDTCINLLVHLRDTVIHREEVLHITPKQNLSMIMNSNHNIAIFIKLSHTNSKGVTVLGKQYCTQVEKIATELELQKTPWERKKQR